MGVGVSWICVISAEMISGEYGVGYRTWQDYTVVDYPGVFVGMVTIGALGRLTATAVEFVGRRTTAWLPRPAARPVARRRTRPAARRNDSGTAPVAATVAVPAALTPTTTPAPASALDKESVS